MAVGLERHQTSFLQRQREQPSEWTLDLLPVQSRQSRYREGVILLECHCQALLMVRDPVSYWDTSGFVLLAQKLLPLMVYPPVRNWLAPSDLKHPCSEFSDRASQVWQPKHWTLQTPD